MNYTEKEKSVALTQAYEMQKKIDDLLPLISDAFNKKDFNKMTDIFQRFYGFSALYNSITKHIYQLENNLFRSVVQIQNSMENIKELYDANAMVINFK